MIPKVTVTVGARRFLRRTHLTVELSDMAQATVADLDGPLGKAIGNIWRIFSDGSGVDVHIHGRFTVVRGHHSYLTVLAERLVDALKDEGFEAHLSHAR